MKKSVMCLLLSLALTFVARDLPAQTADAEGCKDSPLITRFPGSTISSCDNKEYEQAEMSVKDKDGSPVPKTVEGEYHSWDYVTREGVSEIQIFRNFESGKATILPDSDKTLTQIVQLLADTPDLKLRVEGYTDNVGQAAANQSLSEKRAQAVVAWLTAHGVAASRLAAKGLGVANPVADNSTEEGRAKNRRVELVKM